MINLGIIGCAEIAFRRFMPASIQVSGLKAVAVAEEYAPDKLEQFEETYGIEGYRSFDKILGDPSLDAVYILPFTISGPEKLSRLESTCSSRSLPRLPAKIQKTSLTWQGKKVSLFTRITCSFIIPRSRRSGRCWTRRS